MKILIVDDDLTNLYLLESLLKGKGYEVLSARDGKEALEKLKSEEVSLIISDILMPVMDGFMLCRECKSNKELRKIPFVFYTATYTDEKDEELALSMGADRFIRKPIEIEDFLMEIKKVLKEAVKGGIEVREKEEKEEDIFKLYSDRLVKKLEKKMIQLRELSEKLLRITENSNDLIFSLDEEGNFTEVNSVIELYGYKKEEVLGRNFTEFLTPQSQNDALDYFDRARKREGRKDFFEVEFLRKDGEVAVMELNVSTVYENGKFIGRFGIGRDVTEKKKIENAIKSSEERYRLIAENISDVLFTMDMNLRFTYVSPSVTRMRGYSVEEAMAQELKEVLTPSSYELAIRILQEEMEKEKESDRNLYRARTLELENRCKDGSTVWTETRLTFLRDSDGNPAGILGVSRDITQRKRAEEQRKLMEEKYSRLFEESKSAIFITSSHGSVIDVNPAGVVLLGYSSKDELLKKDLLSHYFKDEERETRQKILKEKGVLEDYEFHIKRKDGSEITVLETTHAVRNEKSEIIAYRGIMKDITAYKKMEEQILQSQKMEAIGRLAGGIAHDFNNLLTTIMGNAEILLLNLPKEEPNRERVKAIMNTALRAAQLTRKLLAFSKKQISMPKSVNINNVITDMRYMLERILGEDIKFEIHLASSLPNINIDPTHLEQIILNLSVNAREAMPSGGSLLVSTQNVYLDEEYCKAYPELKPGEYILLAVSDTGIGMTKDILDHIFEPFFTTKKEGTGLGLSIVYGVVKQYDGHITVYTKEGVGTTFKIYFPAIKEAEKREEISLPEEMLYRGSETVLIIEDEDDVRELIETALRDMGYRVFTAPNGKEAEEIMRKFGGEIKLLISDIILPDVRGSELSLKLREEYPGLKILLISGYPDERITIEISEKLDFLPKPFTPRTLAKKVREILNS